jgi:hypothetical protein
MRVGDLIRFTTTGCHGLVVPPQLPDSGAIEYVWVLCGPDVDGNIDGNSVTAFPRPYLETITEVLNASR